MYFRMTEQCFPRNTPLYRNITAGALNHFIVITIHWVKDFRCSARATKVCIALSVEFDAETCLCKTHALP